MLDYIASRIISRQNTGSFRSSLFANLLNSLFVWCGSHYKLHVRQGTFIYLCQMTTLISLSIHCSQIGVFILGLWITLAPRFLQAPTRLIRLQLCRLTELQIRGDIRSVFCLVLHENICCGYSLEAPQWGTSNEYHNICFHGEISKISTFWLKKAHYLVLLVKQSWLGVPVWRHIFSGCGIYIYSWRIFHLAAIQNRSR